MLESSALYSRLLLVSVLVCVAVVPFTMSSDAARASPKTTKVDSGVKRFTLKRLYSPHNPTRPPYAGQPFLQTGANIESENRGNYRVVPSIIYHQSNLVPQTGRGLGYNNIPDNKPSRTGTTSVLNGRNAASSYPTLSYNSHPVNTRKSFHNEATSPSHQRPSPSQVWDAREARKSYIKDKVPGNESPLFSSQTGRYWSPSLPTSRVLHSGYEKTNELTSAGLQRTSSGIQSSKSAALARKTSPRPTSIRKISDAALIKSSLNPERLTTSVADFSHGFPSVSRSETPRLQNIQSYLFKDSQSAFGGHETVPAVHYRGPAALPSAPHKHRDVVGRFSYVKPVQQSQRKPPTKDQLHLFVNNANPLHPNDNDEAQADGYAEYQNTAQISAPRMDAIAGRLNPLRRVNLRGNHAVGDIKSAVSSFSKATPRESTQASTPGQSIKSLHGSRGFEQSERRAAKEPPILSSSEGTNSRVQNSDKRMDNPISNMNPSLSQMYSFGRREASDALVKP
uniref:uncharacterized protein LOC120821574 n=1 Tax=Gasterosteus aculeatus aculeatus TaxID=481459 RepID=UPI001A98F69D|nr:uncharacterized protein LOC120821574 [Gasterosteus aculeatus aculeatus]